MRRRSSGRNRRLQARGFRKRRAFQPSQLEFRFVRLAQRHDARQELGAARAAFRQKRDQRARGAAGRNVDCDIGERRGIVKREARRDGLRAARPQGSAERRNPEESEKTRGWLDTTTPHRLLAARHFPPRQWCEALQHAAIGLPEASRRGGRSRWRDHRRRWPKAPSGVPSTRSGFTMATPAWSEIGMRIAAPAARAAVRIAMEVAEALVADTCG